MRRNQAVLAITDEQRGELSTWAQSRTLPAGDVFRARLILALAEGASYSQIMQTLQTSAPTISRWKQRFEQDGMDGLDPRHKGSQPRVADAAVQARIARKTQQKPSDGSTHWSCRKMAEALGLSKSTVQRIWAKTKLKPHRLDRYMASNDPHFEEKAADIIGLYLNPPQHAAVFCVDETTAIQALDRLDPVLPLSPGRAERHGFEYYRHGTRWSNGRRSGRSTSFWTICRVIRDFLAAHPTVHFHFTPTYSSWLNQVEIWFSKVERDVIARGIFTSVKDLARKLRRYINAYSANARPIQWKYSDPTRRVRSNELTATGH